jgi:hypothetical protein
MSNTRFGINDEQLQRLLEGSLKPEEIAGSPEDQHKRVRELLHWFARGGNPKWLRGHAMELAFYIATGGKLQEIDLAAVEKASFLQGINATDQEREMVKRIMAQRASPEGQA